MRDSTPTFIVEDPPGRWRRSFRAGIAFLLHGAAVLFLPWLLVIALPGRVPGTTRQLVPKADLLPPGATVFVERSVNPFGNPRLLAEIPGMSEEEAADFYEEAVPGRGWQVTKPNDGPWNFVASQGNATYQISASYRQHLRFTTSERASGEAGIERHSGISAAPRRTEMTGPSGTVVMVLGATTPGYEWLALVGGLLWITSAVFCLSKILPRRWNLGLKYSVDSTEG